MEPPITQLRRFFTQAIAVPTAVMIAIITAIILLAIVDKAYAASAYLTLDFSALTSAASIVGCV